MNLLRQFFPINMTYAERGTKNISASRASVIVVAYNASNRQLYAAAPRLWCQFQIFDLNQRWPWEVHAMNQSTVEDWISI